MEGNYLTNGLDLFHISQNCKKCSKTISNGNRIVCYTQLPFILLSAQEKNRRTALIINSSLPGVIGHWSCGIITTAQEFLLLDGLNIVTQQSHFMSNVRKFCLLNKLAFKSAGIRYQSTDTTFCGQLSLSWIAKFTHLPINRFKAMLSLLKRNSIKTNEKYLLKYVQKHFHFKM